MKEPTRIVKVTWIDSSSPLDRAWIPAEEAAKPGKVHCVSLGWLLNETEDFVVLVSSIAPTNDEGDFDVGGTITIPRVAVTNVEELKVSRKNTRKS